MTTTLPSFAATPEAATKVDRIVARLTERIEANEWPEEVPLPSRMRLSEEFNVSPGTITNAINQLQRNGLVHVVPSRGVFISQGVAEQHGRTVYPPVALRGSYVPRPQGKGGSSYGALLVHSLWEAAHQINAPLLLMPGQSGNNRLTRQYCQSLGARGVIFLGGETYQEACDLRRAGLPVLLANRPAEATPLNFVDYDHEATLREALRRLADAGHRRIAVLVSPTTTPGFYEKLKPVFIEELCNREIVYNFNPYWQPVAVDYSLPHPYEPTQESLNALLSLPEPPTAIFSFSYNTVPYVEKASRNRRKPLAHITVGYSHAEKATVSGFVLEHERFGKELLQAMYRTIDDPNEFIQKVLPLTFVDRGTVTPI